VVEQRGIAMAKRIETSFGALTHCSWAGIEARGFFECSQPEWRKFRRKNALRRKLDVKLLKMCD